LALVQQQLAAAFAAEFDVAFAQGELTEQEQNRFDTALAEIDCEDWVHLQRRPDTERPVLEAAIKFPAGLVTARVNYDAARSRIQQLWFTGDFFVSPRRTIADLEAALRDSDARAVRQNVETFFAARAVDMLGLRAEDFSAVIEAALAQQAVAT